MRSFTVTRRRGALLLSLLLAVIVAVTVTIAVRGGDAAPAAANVVKGPHFINAETPGVLTFENGDCFHDPAINAAMGEPRLNTTGCIGSENEVFTFVTLRDGAWDARRVTVEGSALCEQVFRELWGRPGSGRARLDVYPVLPTQQTWVERDDRNAMCVVYSHLGTFTVDPITEGAPE
ncbi:hypothetical protein Q5424_02020 [Conexibacter sp. JD483]|uniref:hypothetical protein n=1 Tax=unclassified Conexibacter TaxID=2627773 RepID=UPI002727B48F|nr:MULTISPECIES: hypothetical protein [unclassified Conexibacter]MDO8185641.1 hypothetical protein [Conexibacter sp. CPCC 205706]MDO8198814.1 hypothetical protein [Conexibacter sp. CPCC 205762]MDR9367836.1 hypothetical protein [Conexibacter sp. JD483]